MDQQTLISLAVFAAVVVGFSFFKRLGQVGTTEARTLVSSGAALVDVRSPGEFASVHLPGALNVPLDQLGAKASTLGAKDRAIVLYCASGTRSAMARSVLKGLGFTRVYNLGAMGRWTQG